MELQLGLGLPNNGAAYELDLNRQFHENGESFDGHRIRGHSDRQRRQGRARARAEETVEYCDRTAESECGDGGSSSSRSNYVKVTMEGMRIGRKVDLSVHCSYESLVETLIDMFGLRYMCDTSVNCFRLVYQDNEGDWLCAEDEPWGSFVESALRLKLIKVEKWD
ncbi:hypothetical protein QQ045_031414 [Rhodiola kirilowii]